MEQTDHKIIFGNSQNMEDIPSKSVDLIVTSPPYPMIKMWDNTFGIMNSNINKSLADNDGENAFEFMHKELDKVWEESYRVLKDGGILCINIGDSVRKINGNFRLFSSHSRIINYCQKNNFYNLPNIIWRKTTNAPNKYMGSGMYPPGAYVTLEHEYILIFRKGKIREFKTPEEKNNRAESAFFWEERNLWFSDVWFDLKGNRQKLNDKNIRERSAAFPIELAYRLILMFSVKDDTVLDPFLGTGSTMAASIISGRNSIGYEIDKYFIKSIKSNFQKTKELSEKFLKERIKKHRLFIENRETKSSIKYSNIYYNLPCISRQENKMKFFKVKAINSINPQTFSVKYSELSNEEFMLYYKL